MQLILWVEMECNRQDAPYDGEYLDGYIGRIKADFVKNENSKSNPFEMFS